MSAEIHYEYRDGTWYAECQSCGWQSEFYGYERDAEALAKIHDESNYEEHSRTYREKYQARLDELYEAARGWDTP